MVYAVSDHMHEIGIAEDILQSVFKALESKEYSKVVKIDLSIGEFNMITQESMQNAFELAAAKTKAEGAALQVTMIPGMDIEITHVEAE